MDESADQYRLCCGGLLAADIVGGKVQLRCFNCGKIWRRLTNGRLEVIHDTGTAVDSRAEVG